ncbi:MAG: hypothetical protein ABL878_11890 [Burkholderiales bacterium]
MRVRLIASVWIILFGVVSLATGADFIDTAQPKMSRIETLELPGLTAGCHVCEWRPKVNHMPAAEQCGQNSTGTAKTGLFECGFTPECERQCNFLECLP